MGLLKEYDELDKIRLSEAEKSRKHYESLDLPGERIMSDNVEAVRRRIKDMQDAKEST